MTTVLLFDETSPFHEHPETRPPGWRSMLVRGLDDTALEDLSRRLVELTATTAWIDVAPPSVASLVGVVAPEVERLVVSPPGAASEHELATVLRAVEANDVHGFVAVTSLFGAGMLKLVTAVKGGRLGQVGAVRIAMSLPRSLTVRRAYQDTATHYQLVGAVAEAWSIIGHLGLTPSGYRVSAPERVSALDTITVQGTDDEGAPSISVTIAEAHRLPETTVEVEGSEGRIRVTRSASRATFEYHRGGRVWREEPAVVPPLEAMASHLDSLVESGAEFASLEGFADAHRAGFDIVDQHLYEHVEALRERTTEEYLKEVAAPGSPWRRFDTTTLNDKRLSLVANEEAAAPYLASLAKPLSLLLVRIPAVREHLMTGRFPPLALAHLAAIARHVGAEVESLDLTHHAVLDRSSARYQTDPAAIVAGIEAHLGGRRVDLVGFSAEDGESLELILGAAAWCKQDHAPTTVVGGHAAYQLDRRVLSKAGSIDYVVYGEGELGLAGLMHMLQGTMGYEEVPGLWDTSALDRHQNDEILHDPAILPRPELGGLDLTSYDAGMKELPPPFIPYLFIVGCPFRCAFCSNQSGCVPRTKTIEATIEEIAALRDEHGVTRFYFLNNMINTTRPYLRKFVEAMRRADLGITWCDCARPVGLDRAILEDLASIGCVSLTWGIDTGSQRVADLMRKGYPLSTALTTIQDAHAAGIVNRVNFIVGLPWETDEDFEETFRFMEAIEEISLISISPYFYSPGSPVHEFPRQFALSKRGSTFYEVGGRSWEQHRRDVRARTERCETRFIYK